MKIYKEYYDKNVRNKTHKYYNDKISLDTMRYQKKYNFELNQRKGHETWNCEADAFKHAYGSTLMAMEKGNLYSSIVGLGHEYKYLKNPKKFKNPQEEKMMDKHNNKVGLNITNKLVKDYAGR